MNNDILKDLRNKIDEIDIKIIELFIQRMNVVLDIKNYKQENNLPTLDFTRENEIIDALLKKYATSPFKDEIVALQIELMRISKNYQNKRA